MADDSLKTKKIDRVKINDFQANEIAQEAVLSKLNCHNIGRVIEFDPATQLCTVELMQNKKFGDQIFQPVPITQIPLIIYGAQNGHITLPNPVGTICLLLHLDRAIDYFKQTGEQYVPNSTRMHDFSDCVAITTFKSLANPLPNYDVRAVSIFNKEIIEEIIYDSLIKVYGNELLFNVTQQPQDEEEDPITTTVSIIPDTIAAVTTNILSQSEKINITNTDSIEIESDTTTIKNDTYENTTDSKTTIKTELGAKIELDTLINIQNTSQNLLTLMQTLIATIKNLTIDSTTMQPIQAVKESLDAQSTNFGALLK